MTLCLSLPSNPRGRDFYCGDLHGMYTPLRDALDRQAFNPRLDRLFCAGDLIDRGPDSLACLALLEEPWFFAVRGNHEALLLESVLKRDRKAGAAWQLNGGDWARDLDDTLLLNLAQRIEARMPLVLEVDNPDFHISLCHASYPLPDWNDRQLIESDPELSRHLLWSRSGFRSNQPRQIAGTDCMVYGHSIVDRPRPLGNQLYIDTGAYLSGRVTLLTTAQVREQIRRPGETGLASPCPTP